MKHCSERCSYSCNTSARTSPHRARCFFRFILQHFVADWLNCADGVWLSDPPERTEYSGKRAAWVAVGLVAAILIGISGALCRPRRHPLSCDLAQQFSGFGLFRDRRYIWWHLHVA